MTRVGIIGGGQLGQMMLAAGVALDLEIHVFSPKAPAVKSNWVRGSYNDIEALSAFAKQVDVLTYEFESLPIASMKAAADITPMHPDPKVLEMSQDRLAQKQFLQSLQIPTAPFSSVDSPEDLAKAFTTMAVPAVLKTRRSGYDGKGQHWLKSPDAGLPTDFPQSDLVLEEKVSFDREVSLISVRSSSGECLFYPLVENIHRDGILRYSIAPARNVTAELQQLAQEHARKILDTLDYVGVLVMEFFEVSQQLIVNEMACRVHNSGHWTIQGAETSQFENHLRAITQRPLSSTEARQTSVMINVIGRFPEKTAGGQDVFYHDYQKQEAPKRKLGHITALCQTPQGISRTLEQYHDVISTDA